jgi:CheY-like chemotaxis protein
LRISTKYCKLESYRKLTSLSAINQQIAIKTIRKLGFKVTAVWNGKEALEYVLAANGPSPSHKKPHIILMDVQMPVIDGYRATHMLRHHAPYSTASRDIPIVAMTASAIQGDREKCQEAGMDDYMAKPVKGKMLEKMLLKWILQERVVKLPNTDDQSISGDPGSTNSEHGSDCEELGEYYILDPAAGGIVARPPHLRPVLSTAASSGSGSASMIFKPGKPLKRPTLAARANSHTLTLPGTESEGDRVVQRSEAEEKAISLRDDKLIVASGRSHEGAGAIPHLPDHDYVKSGQELTVENMGKLEKEQESGGVRSISKARNLSSAVDSGDWAGNDSTGAVGGSPSPSLGLSAGTDMEQRPRVGRRWRDSEQTITGREK